MDFAIVTDEGDCCAYYQDGVYIGHDGQIDLEEVIIQLGGRKIVVTTDWFDDVGAPDRLADVPGA